MKKLYIFKSILTLLFATTFLASCSNYIDEIEPEISNEFAELIDRLKDANTIETFEINPAIDNQIVTDNGSIIIFPASSFVDADGEPVTEGPVHIRITELSSRGDIILQNSSTMTNRFNLLESGGQIRITATDTDDKPLQALGYDIKFNAENTTDYLSKNMGLFRGELDDTTGFITWVDDPLVNDTVKASLDSIGAGTGFFYSFFDVDSLDWINLDRFMDEGEYQAYVKTDVEAMNSSNTIVYFVMEEIMSISTLNTYDADTRQFSNSFYQFPAGYHVKFLVVSSIEDIIYYSLTDNYLLDENIVIEVEMTAISEGELIDIISEL